MGEPERLADVRARVDAAHAAAEALVREAEEAAQAAAEGVPERGWEAGHAPPGAGDARPPGLAELRALLGLLEVARGAVPPELTRPVAEALRELLVALRAVLDWYLERLATAAAPEPPDLDEEPPRPRDIPLE